MRPYCPAIWHFLDCHGNYNPAKTNLQDHARLCKNLACKTCLARARDMSHDSCTILHQFLQKKCARNSKLAGNYSCSISCKISCKIWARLCKNRARIVQEKGNITCRCQASLACKILAQSCMILQVRFCWEALLEEALRSRRGSPIG